MYSNSLTFPSALPSFSPRPRRRFQVPEVLKELKRQVPSLERDGSRLERRLRRSAVRGRRIVLGTADVPYEPLVLGGAPLAALTAFAGLAVVVTTRSPEVVEQLELLAELDQRHAVTVDMLIAGSDPHSPDLRERLRAVSDLAADGITTRLVVTEPPSPAHGLPEGGEAGFRRLFEAAGESRAYDVVTDGLSPVWRRIFDRLRLEYGFPRPLPGRG